MSRSKYLGVIGLIVALVLLSSAIAYWLGLKEGLSFSAESATAPSGQVTVRVYRYGSLIHEYTTHNMIMTIGSKYIRNILGWKNETSTNATDDISLSADAALSKTWNKLPSEITDSGLARASGTASVVNNTAYEVTYTWSSITASKTVNCTGLHWSPDSGSADNMLAAAEISEVSLQAGDSLEVTWTVNIPDGQT